MAAQHRQEERETGRERERGGCSKHLSQDGYEACLSEQRRLATHIRSREQQEPRTVVVRGASHRASVNTESGAVGDDPIGSVVQQAGMSTLRDLQHSPGS